MPDDPPIPSSSPSLRNYETGWLKAKRRAAVQAAAVRDGPLRPRQQKNAKQNRGLDSLAVRGLGKVLGSASLFALTYNILRLITLSG